MRVVARGSRIALAVLGVIALSGCFTYRTVSNPAVGSAVRVNIPVTVSSALSNPGRATESVAVEGILLSVGDTLTLATKTLRSMGAYRDLVAYDTLHLAIDQTTSVQLKEFSSKRSVVLGVVIAGSAGLAGAVAFGLIGGESGDPSPGPEGPVTAVVTSSLVSTVWGLLRR